MCTLTRNMYVAVVCRLIRVNTCVIQITNEASIICLGLLKKSVLIFKKAYFTLLKRKIKFVTIQYDSLIY